jgi:hypothetical protein
VSAASALYKWATERVCDEFQHIQEAGDDLAIELAIAQRRIVELEEAAK